MCRRIAVPYRTVPPVHSVRLDRRVCVGCRCRLATVCSDRSRPPVRLKGLRLWLVEERSISLTSCLGKTTKSDPPSSLPGSSDPPKVCSPISEDGGKPSSAAGTSVDDVKVAVAEEIEAQNKIETIVKGEQCTS